MQNAAFAALMLDAVYVTLRCDAPGAPLLARALAEAGGGGNVTVPHKMIVAAALDRRSDAVRLTGACNTFWLERRRLCGENTDVVGFRAAVQELLGSVADLRTLLIGAGGGARAVVAALAGGSADITVFNRSPARALAFREDLSAVTELRILDPDALKTGSFDLVVNATPLGMRAEDPLPIDLRLLRNAGAALDLVTIPGDTAWIAHARGLGVPAAGGASMLLAQGAAAFSCWWNQPAPVAAMRAALDDALAMVPRQHGPAPMTR